MLTEKEKIQIKQRINDSIKSHEIKVNLLLIQLKKIVILADIHYTSIQYTIYLVYTYTYK